MSEPRDYASSPCMQHEFEAMNGEHVTIYHNPACSKSRQTLALIREHGFEPRIVDYLKSPPDEATLLTLVAHLSVNPEDLVRREEAEFKERFAGRTLSPAAWIQALAKHPKLLQRPIVVRGKRAAIGRPPANILPLLGKA